MNRINPLQEIIVSNESKLFASISGNMAPKFPDLVESPTISMFLFDCYYVIMTTLAWPPGSLTQVSAASFSHRVAGLDNRVVRQIGSSSIVLNIY